MGQIEFIITLFGTYLLNHAHVKTKQDIIGLSTCHGVLRIQQVAVLQALE